MDRKGQTKKNSHQLKESPPSKFVPVLMVDAGSATRHLLASLSKVKASPLSAKAQRAATNIKFGFKKWKKMQQNSPFLSLPPLLIVSFILYSRSIVINACIYVARIN